MGGDGGIRRRGGGGGGYREAGEESGGGLARPKLELNVKVDREAEEESKRLKTIEAGETQRFFFHCDFHFF